MSPSPGDYIDIHNHGGSPEQGVFVVENLMVHEDRLPCIIPGMAFSAGIHPWYAGDVYPAVQFERLATLVYSPAVIAVGEAGFDKLRGGPPDIQRRVFEDQVKLSEESGKPLFIHCVKSWEELLSSHRRMKPRLPWLVHGFRGNAMLATQLIAKNMFISFWFSYVMRPESATLVRSLPPERIFLETDGSSESISAIYMKVAADLGMPEAELRNRVFRNFNNLFTKS